LPPDALATIDDACRLGVDLIEFDVRLNSSGAAVVGHDARSDVALSAVLELIKGRAQAHVDLKGRRGELEITRQCVDALGVEGCIVTTRRFATVKRLRQEWPQLRVGLSIGRDPYRLGPVAILLLRPSELYPWRRLRRCGANLIATHYLLGRLGILAGASRRGLPVLVWTLNSDC
jgi:glycerophosphoryl diester phosphodiesterase